MPTPPQMSEEREDNILLPGGRKSLTVTKALSVYGAISEGHETSEPATQNETQEDEFSLLALNGHRFAAAPGSPHKERGGKPFSSLLG